MSDIEMVNDIQGWCPECGGIGMVMRGESEDCPNLVLHRFLDALTREKVAPSKRTITLSLTPEQTAQFDALKERTYTVTDAAMIKKTLEYYIEWLESDER